jgi:hypothetical protein
MVCKTAESGLNPVTELGSPNLFYSLHVGRNAPGQMRVGKKYYQPAKDSCLFAKQNRDRNQTGWQDQRAIKNKAGRGLIRHAPPMF